MGVMRNHEGYHDPTAGRAIRNAARKERRERGRMPCALTYIETAISVHQDQASP